MKKLTLPNNEKPQRYIIDIDLASHWISLMLLSLQELYLSKTTTWDRFGPSKLEILLEDNNDDNNDTTTTTRVYKTNNRRHSAASTRNLSRWVRHFALFTANHFFHCWNLLSITIGEIHYWKFDSYCCQVNKFSSAQYVWKWKLRNQLYEIGPVLNGTKCHLYFFVDGVKSFQSFKLFRSR